MRDPRAPIPHPTLESTYWQRTRAPKPVATTHRVDFDPTRLVHGNQLRDHLGIDRRTRPREEEVVDDASIEFEEAQALEEDVLDSLAEPTDAEHGHEHEHDVDLSRNIVSGAHRRIDAVLGLETHAGWAIVRTLSFSPNGVLVRVLDPCDRTMPTSLRQRVRTALARLSPDIAEPANGVRRGSLLATVGACLLSPRVVADLSRWTHTESRSATVSSQVRVRPHLSVEVVVPATTPPTGRLHMQFDPVLGPERPAAGTRFAATASPLNDPNDLVLALAMRPETVRALEAHLRGPRRGNRAEATVAQ